MTWAHSWSGEVRQSPGQVEPKQGGLPTFWPLATTTPLTPRLLLITFPYVVADISGMRREEFLPDPRDPLLPGPPTLLKFGEESNSRPVSNLSFTPSVASACLRLRVGFCVGFGVGCVAGRTWLSLAPDRLGIGFVCAPA